jgi:hypothetical protein
MSTLREAEKKKRNLAIGLGCVAAVLVGYQMFNLFGGDSAPPPPAPPVVTTVGKVNGPSAKSLGKTSAQLDPTLHMEPMLVAESLVYSGSGRNIFSGEMEVAPVAIPVPVKSARNAVPPPIPPPIRQLPPSLPPIPLKFFGTSVSQFGVRRAFLLNGDDVFIAAAGDIVDRRYRVVSIADNSILVEDIPNTNKQTLPRTSP